MYRNLSDFVALLEREGELRRVTAVVDPVLEVAEITDRVVKAGGPALLFENTGTGFPVLTNMFGSQRRMELALGDMKQVEARIAKLTSAASGPVKKLRMLPMLGEAAGWLPRKVRGRGECQQVTLGSLDELPILKSWPHDGGRFVTLPLVHTISPVTGARNVGMYRMQVVDGLTTGMHWHVHKTGEKHYREWREFARGDTQPPVHHGASRQTDEAAKKYSPCTGTRMPVTVCLGGDPAYTYCATAPLPDGMDEYLLAGFLRRWAVRLVKCLTNDLWVPEDCDFVIEGYVDTAEEKFMEGPFGDHTGFYSLEDLYPYFHVTAITHRRGAIYPATVVGVPPQEDFHLALATERIFLGALRLIQPEVSDMWMPAAGVAHNLALVSVDVSYPGQALKVASAMWGAGQMMFNKALVLLPSGVDIRDLVEVARRVRNADPASDVMFGRGVLDALDHATATPGQGGKIVLDLTAERGEYSAQPSGDRERPCSGQAEMDAAGTIIRKARPRSGYTPHDIYDYLLEEWGVLAVYGGEMPRDTRGAKYVVLTDEAARGLSAEDLLWHVAANTDPERDIKLSDGVLIIDGRTKTGRGEGYPVRVPNVVVSSPETVAQVDSRWEEYGLGDFIPSPSRRYDGLVYSDGAEIKAPAR